MAMVLGDLLGMIRQDYLDTLHATIAEHRTSGATLELEAATDSAPMFGQTLWHDFTLNGIPQTIASEGVFAFDASITFGWGDALPGQSEPLQVVVQPFAWEAMPVTLTVPAGKAFNPAPLLQWLEQWSAQPEDADRAEAGPFKEVVHSLRQVAPTSFIADLGSAPLDAWQDFLEAALATGASRAVFGAAQA